MTRDDIIRMAREADPGFEADPHLGESLVGMEAIERFAALVAAAEREACAMACEDQRDLREEARAALRAADAIKSGDEEVMLRALRHESDVRLYHAGIDKCAAAIRARGHA